MRSLPPATSRGEEIPLPQGLATLAQLAERRRLFLAAVVAGLPLGQGGREFPRFRLNLGELRGDLGLKQLLDLVIRHAFDAGALDGDGLASQGVDLADQPGDVFQQIIAVGQNLQAGFERRRAAGRDASPDAHPGLGVDGGNRVREEYPFFIHNERRYVICVTLSRRKKTRWMNRVLAIRLQAGKRMLIWAKERYSISKSSEAC